MAKCVVYDARGQRVAEVEFHSSPPDTDAIVCSAFGQRIGSIKARHAVGEGTVYDAQGNVVGTVFGNAVVEDVPCMAMNTNKDTIGGVVNAHQVMWGARPDKWTLAGTVQTESWTTTDDQGLRETMIAVGKGDPGPADLATLVKIVQIKQRVLAGVAALVLRQLGYGMVMEAPAPQVSETGAFAPSTPAPSYSPVTRGRSRYSTGCLVLAFLAFPWLWAVLILSEKEAHATWTRVIAWIILALAALWFLSFLISLASQH